MLHNMIVVSMANLGLVGLNAVFYFGMMSGFVAY